MMLRIPVIALVLAATVFPVELRTFGAQGIDVTPRASDIVANVLGYVPVGIVLAGLGSLPAIAAATLMSAVAEIGQLVMMHRFPSPIDLASNLAGALVGVEIGARWQIRSPAIPVDRRAGVVAGTLAFALLGMGAWGTSHDASNNRGLASPGVLEGHWRFDESSGPVTPDSSGHGLHGKLMNGPVLVPGKDGNAVRLDGVADYIDFGNPLALRLIGSMTIAAWILPARSHPTTL